MKYIKIILAWLIIFPLLFIAYNFHKIYLYILDEINDFDEIVIKQIK
jgi:hypothetical protein